MAKYLSALSLSLLAGVLLLPASLRAAPGSITDGRTGWSQISGGAMGNPLVGGAGDLARAGVLRDRFRQAPRWMVSGDLNGDGRDELAILFADGNLEVQGLENGRLRRLASWSGISPEAAPVAVGEGVAGGSAGLLCVDDRGDLALYTVEGGQGRTLQGGLSALTFPAVGDLDGDGKADLVAVGERGDLLVLGGNGVSASSRDTTLLPDTRISLADINGDGKKEAVVLTRPLDKIKSTRLGDETQAQGVAVFTWDGSSLRMQDEFRLDGRRYFETLTPLLADLERTGKLSLVIPVCEEDGGCALWSLSWSGRNLRKDREGPKTRDGKSSCQAIAVSPLGDQDRTVILAVTGPEGQGTLEALRTDLANTRLGTSEGILTHLASSRTIDLALVGDFAGRGKRELLAPGKDGTTLRLFTFTGGGLGSREVFSGSKTVSANLCPGDFDGDGRLDVAFGAQDGSLVILTGK